MSNLNLPSFSLKPSLLVLGVMSHSPDTWGQAGDAPPGMAGLALHHHGQLVPPDPHQLCSPLAKPGWRTTLRDSCSNPWSCCWAWPNPGKVFNLESPRDVNSTNCCVSWPCGQRYGVGQTCHSEHVRWPGRQLLSLALFLQQMHPQLSWAGTLEVGWVAVPSKDLEDGARAELETCCSSVTQPKNTQSFTAF